MIVSDQTYRDGRSFLLSAARSYRIWAAREPEHREKFLGHLRAKQRQMAHLRAAVRIAIPEAVPLL